MTFVQGLTDLIQQRIKPTNTALSEFVWPLGGEFLLDPNEMNGWGVRGAFDDRHATDLGNSSAAMSRNAGGLVFPWDLQLERLYAWHRNSNGDAQAWGWQLNVQTKTDGANTITNTVVLDEVADNGGAGPRNYSNNTNQLTDITLPAPVTIAAGDVLTLAVNAPTAVTTNRYVQIEAGYLLFRRAIP